MRSCVGADACSVSSAQEVSRLQDSCAMAAMHSGELHAAEPPLEKRALSWSRCIAFAQVILGDLAMDCDGK